MTATAPELSKSDFFDFVTSNEVTDAQYKQQMRSVNVFMDSDSRSNPLLSDEPKEQNNNSVSMAGAAAPAALQSFDSIWNVDRDRERLDGAMLDLNKYYWSQEEPGAPDAAHKLLANDTDGQIYTLTVLNQDLPPPPPPRYWPKDEDVSLASPAALEPNALDLDSILNMNGFPHDFPADSLSAAILPKAEGYYDDTESDNPSGEMTTSNLVKVESYNNYEDGEFQPGDKQDDSRGSLAGPPSIEAQIEYHNNNNDWKLSDQNQNVESQESLLRKALQGKASIRYTVQNNVITKLDSNAELKRVIINNNKGDVPSMYQDKEDTELLMSISPESGNVNISILLDEGGAAPAPSVDDLLLSQLDASYPDDYEKLKHIASELGEAMPPFCTVEPLDGRVYNIQHVTMVPAELGAALMPAVSSSKPAKKYKRAQSKGSPPAPAPAVQPATSTSNGVRKERSLHYCSICSKGFKDKYSVNVHVRTHTGEKPFACSLCGKSFRQKAHLAKHYQTHIAQKTAAANGALKPAKQR